MTYSICEPCIDVKDRACVDECPVDCIYEGPRMLYIQPDSASTERCEPACPVTAIFYEDDVPPSGSSSMPSTRSGSTTTSVAGSPGGAAQVGPAAVDRGSRGVAGPLAGLVWKSPEI